MAPATSATYAFEYATFEQLYQVRVDGVGLVVVIDW
jgi:hypothetical protein